MFSGIRARVGLCAVGASRLLLEAEPLQRGRVAFSGRAVAVAAAAAAAGQGGMVLIPQSTFRQLHLELLAEQCLVGLWVKAHGLARSRGKRLVLATSRTEASCTWSCRLRSASWAHGIWRSSALCAPTACG